MRRAIATHMVDSMLRTAPHVTSVFDADLTAVLRHKEEYRDAGDRPTGRPPRLTLTAYFVKAAAVAAQVVPQINSRWHDDALEILPSVDIGVATALGDEGLIVPIVRRAHELDLEEIAAALEELTAHARAGTLAREDVIGGTLTITNHGVSGSLMATPIINQPQSAIVGIGRLEKRVKVVTVDGQDSIQIRPMVYVTLTIDHRALDGYQANRYLSAFVETLEEWD
jgi:2-oxoglutarate dehydrogenase E2 component (dihydrolipoamide succinyltransferase)